MSDQSIVEVTQADRALFISLFHIPTRHQAGVLSSSQDATVEMQSIARHRIAEREACAVEVEKHYVENAHFFAAAIRARS